MGLQMNPGAQPQVKFAGFDAGCVGAGRWLQNTDTVSVDVLPGAVVPESVVPESVVPETVTVLPAIVVPGSVVPENVTVLPTMVVPGIVVPGSVVPETVTVLPTMVVPGIVAVLPATVVTTVWAGIVRVSMLPATVLREIRVVTWRFHQ